MRKFEFIGVLFVMVGILPYGEQFVLGGTRVTIEPNTSLCDMTDLIHPPCFSSSSGEFTEKKYKKTTIDIATEGGVETYAGSDPKVCYQWTQYEAGEGAWGFNCNPTNGCEDGEWLDGWLSWCYPPVVTADFPYDELSDVGLAIGEE